MPQAAIERQRANLALNSDTRVVGFVGRLAAKRKGFRDFLAAGQKLLQRMPEDVRFLIIGEPDAGKADAVLPQVAREYGIFDRCIFLGKRPNVELPSLYALMDVLVLPSLFEGVPRALMEATAMQVPIVATDVKGNREVVESGYNGFLVPLGDTDALTSAIQTVLGNPEKARQMGAAGRRIAVEQTPPRRHPLGDGPADTLAGAACHRPTRPRGDGLAGAVPAAAARSAWQAVHHPQVPHDDGSKGR